jgi:acetylornithine deacetylase
MPPATADSADTAPIDEVELLTRLVSVPSVSGDEAAVAALVQEVATGLGLQVTRDDAAVVIEVCGAASGPTLALVSHLDVVPVGQGWTRAPFAPTVEDDRLYGRGACDAKASVAAMICAAADLAQSGRLARGRVLVVLGYSEETRDTSMPRAVPRLGPLDAAIIGEPTSLQLAVAQRGLMVVELHAHGEQRHAAYAADGGGYRNAVFQLARDLCALPNLLQDKPHPLLGQPTLTPTMLEAGVARNVAPPLAKALLDLRTTPAWPHAEVGAALRAVLESEVVVASERLAPCETPSGSRLLLAAQKVRPQAQCYGSPTCSDWVFLRHLDAIKCGPGQSLRSHTPDEFVELSEVRAARRFYVQLAQEYLS